YAESKNSGISLYIHLPFCENLCTYCGCNTRITKNHQVELPYIEAVLKEWNMYTKQLNCKPRIREIHLGGGTPTFFSPENLNTLINGILLNAEVIEGAEFSFEAHPANTTRDHLQTFFDLGFRRLSLGIQDFDPIVQEIINRKQTVEQVESVTQDARKMGYTSINYDLIYGLPLQKIASIESTIAQVIRLKPDRIAFYSYAHVPWIKPGQRKFTELDLPADDTKRDLYETGRALLMQAGFVDIGMDHFALKSDSLYHAALTNTIHRNFMGYTDQATQLLIGLGVSSISDSLYAFAQNSKTVEQYLKNISEGRFSFLKGHKLTATDLSIRKQILDIMCRGYAKLSEVDDLNPMTKNQLQSLESDGLIELQVGFLKVTDIGKAFLRNICMAFDQRLLEKAHESQIFSTAV
ncbi:MAG: oxygen-independent coproporphyrinogen oxidase, partial [Daejeonella sp.]|nr:oxygen-independent coproporphyrinogen oxidase [Daejeonella sp.]